MNNMDSQTPVSNDRSRTYWTPTMERYFIDLMLEHMRRGNRIGHTFNKQAWNDMLLVFNEKFGSQYDKDVLKSRYSNLWKQFNDTKNLLGQSGFSWDDTQQMVVADEHVWDTYTKAHPDARPYKTKPVFNFNDLCLIYGYTVADGRYSRSSHDMDKDDEIHGVNLCDGIGSLASSNGERSRTEWTTDMDQYFLELMLDQQERGNKLDNTFSKQAWTDMLGLFNAKFGDHHTKRVLRHRYRKLFKYYSDVAILLKQNGFSWDEKQKIVAGNDDVWNAYIKGHPNARSYRTKCLPNFDDLGLIFGDAVGNKIRYKLQLDKDLVDENVVVKAGSERTRTYWTPPMDRYLINLLLTEVHHGNRIGQTLIGKSWNDMVTSFNENFRSHHDKDVLKNRYKHLRKQYNDVKVLLGQTGFSWDETREMVTAEDHVWDAYIEVHPDARSYRVKTVPSYHKLHIIYGEDSLDGRYSHLACNVGEESEVSLLSTDERKEHESQSNTIPMIDWTPPMDRYFIDLALEKVHSGNKVDLTFEDQEWIEMIASFNKRFGQCFDKYVLETRLLCLMKQYRDIRNLLAQQGFAWDDAEQMVTAADDAWEAYSKEHPRAISYRGKCLEYFMDLHTFFGSVMNDDVCENMGLEIDHSLLDMEFVEICEELQISGTQTETSNEGKKRPPITTTPARSSKLQKTGKEDIQDAFSDVANIISKLVKGKDAKRHIATERSIHALQAIPDIDNELLLDACDLLEDERKAKTFLALDASLRRKWLLRKLSCWRPEQF